MEERKNVHSGKRRHSNRQRIEHNLTNKTIQKCLCALLVLCVALIPVLAMTYPTDRIKGNTKNDTVVANNIEQTTQPETTQPETTQPETTAEPETVALAEATNTNKTICIDPGHGGNIGCNVDGVFEDVVVLDIAEKVKTKLESSGFKTLMIREDNETSWNVYKRPEIANEAGVDMYVSIHANSEGDTSEGTAKGIETWYNESNSAGASNTKLAKIIQKELIASTGAEDKEAKVDDLLVVLLGANMPSCLVETGFLTNPDERKLLQEDDYQDKVATGIANGIIKYFNQNK